MEEGEAVKGLESPVTVVPGSVTPEFQPYFFLSKEGWASVTCEQKDPEQCSQGARRRIKEAYRHKREC